MAFSKGGDNFQKFVDDTEEYLVDPTDVINPGDLMRWDPAAGSDGELTTLDASGNFANFVGVSQGAVPFSSNLGNATNDLNRLTAHNKGLFLFDGNASEVYVHGDPVKRGSTDQAVALDGGANEIIGYVWLPLGTTLTNATGVKIPVRIFPNFPNTDLAS